MAADNRPGRSDQDMAFCLRYERQRRTADPAIGRAAEQRFGLLGAKQPLDCQRLVAEVGNPISREELNHGVASKSLNQKSSQRVTAERANGSIKKRKSVPRRGAVHRERSVAK